VVNLVKNSCSSLDNYPNPFSSQTNIEFEISSKSKVVLEIYTLNGQKIKQLVNDEMSAGKHSLVWNARDEANSQVDPGLYLCRMQVDNQAELSKQMVVVK
jgi:flagellar hook assembly protein FlgD